MFEVLHWRFSPTGVAPAQPPTSPLELAIHTRSPEAAAALLLPHCDPRMLMDAFDGAAADVQWRRGCAALLCEYVELFCAFTPPPEPVQAWCASRCGTESDTLVRLLLVAAGTADVIYVREEEEEEDDDEVAGEDGTSWQWHRDARRFAVALCAYEERLIRRMDVRVLGDVCAHSAHDHGDADDTDDALLQLCACLPAWVATQVLAPRATSVPFFVRAAHAAAQLRAWNAFCLLMDALSNAAVRRLPPEHWDGVRSLWSQLSALQAQCATPHSLSQALPSTPPVAAYRRVAAARQATGRPVQALCAEFARRRRRCVHGLPLGRAARLFFRALHPRQHQQRLMRASLQRSPEPRGLRSTVAGWFRDAPLAPTPPLVHLTTGDWEEVFANASLRRLEAGLAEPPPAEALAFFRVRKGQLGPHAVGTILCSWTEPYVCSVPVELEQSLIGALDSRLRVRVLRAYCMGRLEALGGAFVPPPAPPLLLDRTHSAKWSCELVRGPRQRVLRAGRRCSNAYFLLSGSCEAGTFFPGMDASRDAHVLGDEAARFIVVPDALLAAHTPLAVLVMERIALALLHANDNDRASLLWQRLEHEATIG